MARMVTNRLVGGWAGIFFIAAGLFAVVICGLASLNLIADWGPLALPGVFGGVCAIITGARWLREATRPGEPAAAEEPSHLV